MSQAGERTKPLIRGADPEVLGDADRFLREIAEPCIPTVFRRAVPEWPAARAAAESAAALLAYLRRFAAGSRAEAFVGAPAIAGRYAYTDAIDGFNFERVTTDLPDLLDRIAAGADDPEQPSIYLGSLETRSFFPGLVEENPMAAVPRAVSPRIWIGNASDVSCHNDNFDNIACVVAGHRRFTLYPPEATADLYIGPIDFTMAGRPVALAAGSPPGDPRYPRFEPWRERAMTVELAPGDALYLPKLWWHQVEATDRFNVLINYWWDAFSSGPDAPYTAMMLAMIAVAERPPAERAAWRALFDHYAFRPGGHPLAHLPPERHGILGPLQGTYGRIRAHVMQLLRGGG